MDMVIYFMKKFENQFVHDIISYLIIILLISFITLSNNKIAFAQNLTKDDYPHELGIYSNTSSTHFYLDEYIDSPDYYLYKLKKSNQRYKNLTLVADLQKEAKIATAHIPIEFQYEMVDKIALKEYLEVRNSILADEPYFSSIIDVSKDFNINPLLLFAITGQEQGFVPKNHNNAPKIANNPYNVFCSWQVYNTDIVDSSKIACRTIINLSKNKPEDIDIFTWINRKYSEDKNWNYGVRSLYEDLKPYAFNSY